MTKRHLRNLSEIYLVASDIVFKRYPSFVYYNSPAQNEIPVFCLHSVEPLTLETTLQFLAENKYHTLTTDEFYHILLKNTRSAIRKAILLTFDDGMGSIWSVAYPLLKKYGFKATVFLIPGRIKHSEQYNPNLEDVWRGKATIEEVIVRDRSEQPMATWEEIKTMHESRVVDFQSHTLHHNLIYTSPTILDFVTPFSLSKFHPFEFSMFMANDTPHESQSMPQIGAPLYTAAPRMSGALKYFDDPGLRERCITYVKENGNEMFFSRKNWRKLLFQIADEHKRNYAVNDRYETPTEQEQEIFTDLSTSKQTIEQHLADHNVQHLCYPWGVGSSLSLNLSKRVGYCTNFWGRVDNRLTNKTGQDLFKVARVGEDFLCLLPGARRSTLGKVLLKKIQKRLKRGSPYLSH